MWSVCFYTSEMKYDSFRLSEALPVNAINMFYVSLKGCVLIYKKMNVWK